MTRLLSSVWSLYDVQDVERFAAAIVSRSKLELSYHDHDDAVSWLVEECWLLSERFQPGGISFSTFAGTTLRRRLVDWRRSRDGRTVWKFSDRTHTRPKPQLVSFDELDPVGNVDAGSASDSTAAGFASLGGLVAAGSSQTDRDIHTIRRLVS